MGKNLQEIMDALPEDRRARILEGAEKLQQEHTKYIQSKNKIHVPKELKEVTVLFLKSQVDLKMKKENIPTSKRYEVEKKVAKIIYDNSILKDQF